jgi:hypothetical protein
MKNFLIITASYHDVISQQHNKSRDDHMNMNFKKISLLPLLLGLAMAGNIASADEGSEAAMKRDLSPEQQEAAKQKWESMTPEEQAAAKAKREQRKQQYQNMSPEEQAAAKAKREQRKQQYQNMSPEEQQAVKDKLNKSN